MTLWLLTIVASTSGEHYGPWLFRSRPDREAILRVLHRSGVWGDKVTYKLKEVGVE